MQRFDHFVLAAPDLDAAKEEFAAQTGCLPADGGAHTGLGTRNALASFGHDSYLEIIAPDPAQALENNMGERLAALTRVQPLAWAVRVDNLEAVARAADALGFQTGPIIDTARMQPNGERLAWQLMGIRGGHELGGLVPFYIDWLDCPHPATTNPVAGTLAKFELSLPAGPVHALLTDVEGLALVEGPAGIILTFASELGEITYTANTLDGFTL